MPLPFLLLLHAGDPLHHLWSAWAWEPWILVPLALAAALYARGTYALGRQRRHAARRRRVARSAGTAGASNASFWAGWAVLVVALASPLHPLSEQLFSAHMVQHELLMAVAAPLLVLGHPLVPALWALPPRWRRAVGRVGRAGPLRAAWRGATRPFVAWTLHAVAIWTWHVPRLFDAATLHEPVHALQHASFLGTALLFWWALVHGRRRTMAGAMSILYLFTTALHTTALGALLTFAHRPWYAAYASSAADWGLSPLEDQQLAGLIMWIPASLSYLVAALALMARALAEPEPGEWNGRGSGVGVRGSGP